LYIIKNKGGKPAQCLNNGNFEATKIIILIECYSSLPHNNIFVSYFPMSYINNQTRSNRTSSRSAAENTGPKAIGLPAVSPYQEERTPLQAKCQASLQKAVNNTQVSIQREYVGPTAANKDIVETAAIGADTWIEDAIGVAIKALERFTSNAGDYQPHLTAFEAAFGEVTDRAEIEFVLGNLQKSIAEDWDITDIPAQDHGYASTTYTLNNQGVPENVSIRLRPTFYTLEAFHQEITLAHEFQHAGWDAQDVGAAITNAYNYENFISACAEDDNL
jgi:hypothetical protein